MVRKIAVFGGTGTIGQSVVEYALSEGKGCDETVACDSLTFSLRYDRQVFL